jgi:hypothetical protein
MGTGNFNSPKNQMVPSWNWRNISGSDQWVSQGGDFYASSCLYSQSFSYGSTLDVNVQCNNTVKTWYSGICYLMMGF